MQRHCGVLRLPINLDSMYLPSAGSEHNSRPPCQDQQCEFVGVQLSDIQLWSADNQDMERKILPKVFYPLNVVQTTIGWAMTTLWLIHFIAISNLYDKLSMVLVHNLFPHQPDNKEFATNNIVLDCCNRIIELRNYLLHSFQPWLYIVSTVHPCDRHSLSIN